MGGAQSPRQTQRAQPPAEHPQQSTPSSRTARLRAAQTGQAWPELGVGVGSAQGGSRRGRRRAPRGRGGPPRGGGGADAPSASTLAGISSQNCCETTCFYSNFYFEKVTVT